MLNLEAIYICDSLVTTLPRSESGTFHLSEDVMAYPTAYRCLAAVLQHKGFNPRRDLPHEGDQEGVRQLLGRNRTFLEDSDGVLHGTKL